MAVRTRHVFRPKAMLTVPNGGDVRLNQDLSLKLDYLCMILVNDFQCPVDDYERLAQDRQVLKNDTD